MKKVFVLLFLAVLFALPAFAQVGSVSGTVLTEDREPVQGAGVSIWNNERDHFETRTDEEGAFAFERVPVGAWHIHAEMECMEPADDEIEVAANENTEINLVLEGDDDDDGVGSVSGTVFNQRREAVAGAVIHLISERREIVGRTQTDDEGTFLMEEIPAGGYTIVAEHGDLTASEQIRVVADEETVVRLVLGEGGGDRDIGRISGTVSTPEEEPAVRAVVCLFADLRGRPEFVARTGTDENGAFFFSVPAGEYHITAELEDVGVAEDDIEVTANEETVIDLVLGDGEIGPEYGVKEQNANIPVSAVLLKSFPNPFNAVATISYNLPVATHVRLSVFNTEGRHIQTLSNGWCMAGEYRIEFNGYSLPTGTYILRLDAGKLTQTTKLQLLK